MSHKGSPRTLEWVAYPFSSRSSRPRIWTGVSCIAGGFFTNWAMLYWRRQRNVEKSLFVLFSLRAPGPFPLLEGSGPLSPQEPWTSYQSNVSCSRTCFSSLETLDFLSTYLGTDSLSTREIVKCPWHGEAREAGHHKPRCPMGMGLLWESVGFSLKRTATFSIWQHPSHFSGGKNSTILRGHPSSILRLCSSVRLPLSLDVGKGCDPGMARQSDHVEFRERPWV